MEDWLLYSLILAPATALAFYFFSSSSVETTKDGKKARDSTFSNTATGIVSILSNNDSILNREGVDASVEGYTELFSGARQSVGSISTDESIRKRELEYKSMVDSFYNLVTDFYEWGWGQVRENKTKNG